MERTCCSLSCFPRCVPLRKLFHDLAEAAVVVIASPKHTFVSLALHLVFAAALALPRSSNRLLRAQPSDRKKNTSSLLQAPLLCTMALDNVSAGSQLSSRFPQVWGSSFPNEQKPVCNCGNWMGPHSFLRRGKLGRGRPAYATHP